MTLNKNLIDYTKFSALFYLSATSLIHTYEIKYIKTFQCQINLLHLFWSCIKGMIF